MPVLFRWKYAQRSNLYSSYHFLKLTCNMKYDVSCRLINMEGRSF